ncbi:5'-AMP-activated protein kinase subunit beta-2 [Sparganum proliferum]
MERAVDKPKVLFSYINGRLKNKKTILMLKGENIEDIIENDDKAEHISRFFVSVFTDETDFDEAGLPTGTIDEIIENMDFTEGDVRKELLALKEGNQDPAFDTSDEPPPQPTLPTVFKWEGGGKDVYISGTFNGWKSKIPMVKSKQNFYTIIDLPEGEHQYKFIVDGQWKLGKDQPTVTSSTGVQNNTITVNLSDFDVIETLTNMDAVPTGSSPPGEYGQVIPPNPATQIASSGLTPGVSSTGAGGQPAPTALGIDAKSSKPPLLPPQLLQVILNRDTNVHCDPNLLPQPNHVMLNHMYALSIKDGVIVLSAISRYRQKFVSTVLYKPI